MPMQYLGPTPNDKNANGLRLISVENLLNKIISNLKIVKIRKSILKSLPRWIK